MKNIIIAISIGIVTGCSNEPTEAEINERTATVSSEECKSIESIDEHEKIIEAIKRKCASMRLREFEFKESSEQSW